MSETLKQRKQLFLKHQCFFLQCPERTLRSINWLLTVQPPLPRLEAISRQQLWSSTPQFLSSRMRWMLSVQSKYLMLPGRWQRQPFAARFLNIFAFLDIKPAPTSASFLRWDALAASPANPRGRSTVTSGKNTPCFDSKRQRLLPRLIVSDETVRVCV